MSNQPRLFSPAQRLLLAIHVKTGRLDTDERELLREIVAGDERWGITPEEARLALLRARRS
jgi:hypothetical protein